MTPFYLLSAYLVGTACVVRLVITLIATNEYMSPAEKTWRAAASLALWPALLVACLLKTVHMFFAKGHWPQ